MVTPQKTSPIERLCRLFSRSTKTPSERKAPGFRSRLGVEPLEDRRMLSVCFVDTDAAAGGDGQSWAGAYQDLQAALDYAGAVNSDEIGENDVDQIWIAEGVYKPSVEVEPGEARSASFSLVDGVTLHGGFVGTESTLGERDPAAHATTLSGDLGTIDDDADNARTVVYCGSEISAGLEGLSITGGNADGERLYTAVGPHTDGGGVFNEGSLTVTNCVLVANRAGSGAGILNDGGTLNAHDSRFVDNLASGDHVSGGGLRNYYGVASVIHCIFEGNTAIDESGARGGGIDSSGTLTVEDSVVRDNTVDGGTSSAHSGGGIYARGEFTLANSIVWGNRALQYCSNSGGIRCEGEIVITNSTISHNSAMWTGGIRAVAGTGPTSSFVMNNTLVAENAGGYFSPDAKFSPETYSGTNNLIGDGSSQDLFIDGVDGNQVGTHENPINPLLSDWTQLDDGSWGYHLLEGSPAVDAGNNAVAVDPQGEPLTADVQGNTRIQNGTVDVGAVEGVPAEPAGQTYVVTSLTHVVDPGDGELTFIEALEAAGSNQPVGDAPAGSFAEQDVIEFAEGVTGTIYLDGQALENRGDLRIIGPGADLLRIDAQGESRLFTVEPLTALTLEGMTLTGGNADYGGAILNGAGNLAIVSSTVMWNKAEYGGGVHNDFGTVEIVSSRFLGNEAIYNGGGVENYYGTLTVSNSEFVGNATTTLNSGGGGAILNYDGTLAVYGSTLTENMTTGTGGGIWITDRAPSCTLHNSLLTRNYGSSGEWNIHDGTWSSTEWSSSNNLIGERHTPIDPRFVRDPSPGADEQWGTSDDDYGDLTLLADSPAINAGDASLLPMDTHDLDADGVLNEPLPIDLAGTPRVENDVLDIGAYETTLAETVIYVNHTAPTGGDGLTWKTAFSDLDTALDSAAARNADSVAENNVADIWIAEGTYAPSSDLPYPYCLRTETFELISDVALRGGFAGTETTLSQRDLSLHETVLSGDMGVQGDRSDNAYTVVTCGAEVEAVLDGLTIADGNADEWGGAGYSKEYGGGIHNLGALTIANCTIRGNSAHEGGGVWSSDGPLTVVNSVFIGNEAFEGSAVRIRAGYSVAEPSAVFVNVSLARNTAPGDGSAINSSWGITALSNCILFGNEGGDIQVSGDLIESNSLIGIDPEFVRDPSTGSDGIWGTSDDDYGDLRLRPNSPGVDTGSNTLLPADTFDLDGDSDVDEPIPYDLVGTARIIGGVVDMGAYETLAGDLNADGVVNGSDLDIVRANWGQAVPPGDALSGDASWDGLVNSNDLDLIRANWGDGTPSAAAADALFGTGQDTLGERTNTPMTPSFGADSARIYGPRPRVLNPASQGSGSTRHDIAAAALENWLRESSRLRKRDSK